MTTLVVFVDWSCLKFLEMQKVHFWLFYFWINFNFGCQFLEGMNGAIFWDMGLEVMADVTWPAVGQPPLLLTVFESLVRSFGSCGVTGLRTMKLTFRMSVPGDVPSYERPHGGPGHHWSRPPWLSPPGGQFWVDPAFGPLHTICKQCSGARMTKAQSLQM